MCKYFCIFAADMKKQFVVAGFGFEVEASEAQLEGLTNYAPFEVEKMTAPLLFHLHVGDYPLPEKTEHVYTSHSDMDMPRIEIAHTAEGWLLEESVYQDAPICMHIAANKDFSEAYLTIEHEDYTRFAMDNAMMLLYAFTTADKGVLEMHASVTVYEDKGYLFLGKSGTGKSTHSQQWLKHFEGSWLLNDDNPILRLEHTSEGNEVWVYGSPWSGKTPCYKNARARVGGIVKLTQAPQNVIHTLRLSEAYAYMLSSASGLKIIPEMMDHLYETIAAIIQTVQLYGLECLPDTAAAETCYHGINS